MAVTVFDNLETLSRAAAERVATTIKALAIQKDAVTLVLSGGNTPKKTYEILALPPYQNEIPWKNVHLFWGDERCVPPSSPDSNYRMAHEALISKISIPTENVHRMLGELEPQSAAKKYEQELRQFFGNVSFPSFDLILLGMGPDGHTASLFPGTSALEEKTDWVTAPFVEKFNTHRLTFTPPVINNAKEILFLVSGKDKTEVLHQVLTGTGTQLQYPVQLIKNATWFVDHLAAGALAT